MARAVGRSWVEDIISTKLDEQKKINGLLWGPTGGGKTHFLGTVENIFILWYEDGSLTLSDKDIPGYKFESGQKIYETTMAILNSIRHNEGIFEKIDAIAIDSIWKLNQLLMEEICVENKQSGMRIQDWGTLRNRLGAIVTSLISIDKHFFATVGETTKTDELTGDTKPAFNFNGGYAGQVDYEFDYVLYFRSETRGPNTYYKMYTSDVDGRKAKARMPGDKKLPRSIDDPSFDKLWSLVKG